MSALNPRDGYRLWAPTYSRENAISSLEAALVDAMTPPLTGLRLLDAGCGTGRRLHECGAASVVGVDLSPEMIEAGIGLGEPLPHILTLVGDVRDLPLPDADFDVLWCRLVIGHLPDYPAAYAELARVATPGATVIVTDFHAAAHAAGHRRTFREGDVVHEIIHHVHPIEDQIDQARALGLTLRDRREATIGPAARPFYVAAGRDDLYAEHFGLPVVSALAFQRER